MNRPLGILFDLDGVLIDSEPSYTRFWQMIDGLYPTGVARFAHVIKGNTLSTILSTYFSPEVHVDITSRLHRFEHTAPYPPFPGAFDTLYRLHQMGYKIALVTSSDNDKMANLYNQHHDFKAYFDAIVTADDVTKSKPDPQGYLIAASRLSLSPSECVVVEDSPAGLHAGRRSGAAVFGLATTVSASQIIDDCDVLLDSIGELSSALNDFIHQKSAIAQ
ncbi:MAG: HAD family hydrolase [Muribaculaceae bacterium]|nr:HAD family hydrolase [Muribaculaceae bacterium]